MAGVLSRLPQMKIMVTHFLYPGYRDDDKHLGDMLHDYLHGRSSGKHHCEFAMAIPDGSLQLPLRRCRPYIPCGRSQHSLEMDTFGQSFR